MVEVREARYFLAVAPPLHFGRAAVACGLGVTLVPNVAVRSALPPTATYRPLTSPAHLVELSLVTRESAHEPLVNEFLRIAVTQPHDTT